MKKYYANYLSLIIQEVEVLSETPQTVVLSQRGNRQSKDSAFGSYQDTYAAAKEKLSAYIDEKIKESEYRIKCAKEYIFTLNQAAAKL